MVNIWNKTSRHTLLGPGPCVLCQANSAKGRAVCDECAEDLSPSSYSYSSTMGSAGMRSLDLVSAVYLYQFPTSNLVWQLKYKHDIRLAPQFAQDLSRHVLQKGIPLPDKLVPVPTHPTRLIQRGFNQSLLITEHLGKELGIPHDNALVARTRNTLPQHSLSPMANQGNVRDAFMCRNLGNCKSIAIVDDVVTTGSTANEIARTLKKAGAKQVFLWAWVSAQ